jgi:hypothetical protein
LLVIQLVIYLGCCTSLCNQNQIKDKFLEVTYTETCDDVCCVCVWAFKLGAWAGLWGMLHTAGATRLFLFQLLIQLYHALCNGVSTFTFRETGGHETIHFQTEPFWVLSYTSAGLADKLCFIRQSDWFRTGLQSLDS